MEENNFYTDITSSVKEIFCFLQSEFHFSDFKENNLPMKYILLLKINLVQLTSRLKQLHQPQFMRK